MSESYFVLKFRLKTEKWQEDIMDKRFEAGRKIYNALVSKSLKVLRELEKTKAYREAYKKKDWEVIDKMRKDAGLTKYGLMRMMTPLRHPFKEYIASHIAQALVKRLWKSYSGYFYRNGKRIMFKGYNKLNSLESTDTRSGIVYKETTRICVWSGLYMPVLIDENNSYEMESLERPIAFSRICREWIRGKKKYYIQIVFKGIRPAKRRKSDGSFIQNLGKGDVGIDIGTSTVAISSETDVKIFELASRAQGCERIIANLRRKQARSMKATNPDNYNYDGTIKFGSIFTVKSNRYKKIILKLSEVFRKQRVIRKMQHEILSNYLLSTGDRFFVEHMDFSGLAKKKQGITYNKDGKTKSNHQYGKTIVNRAPAMFLEILDRKLHYFGKELIKINTFEAKASQFNHVTQEYKKKSLSQRWTMVDGHKVQRDMYSAFLIMNVDDNLESYNLEKCNSRFDNFLELHDKEVNRLKGRHNLKSIGI